MSSPTFDLTFDRAAEIIESSRRDPNVKLILDDFKTRADDADHNPLSNRDLIVDSRVDSQMLGVSEDLYADVVGDLRRFQLLHVWVRATCPNTDEVVIETRKEKKFRRALREPCPHCGQDHSDLTHDNIEYFFAINFELSEDKLKLIELSLRGPKPPPNKKQRTGLLHNAGSIWRQVSALFRKRDDSPVEATATTLSENRPAKIAPTTHSILWRLWRISATWWTVTLIVFFVLRHYENYFAAWIVGGVSLTVYALLSYITWRSIFYRFPVQRRILAGSQLLGGLALSKGALGLKFRWKNEDGEPASTFLQFGETDQTFVWAGTVIIAVGFICTAIVHCFEKAKEI